MFFAMSDSKNRACTSSGAFMDSTHSAESFFCSSLILPARYSSLFFLMLPASSLLDFLRFSTSAQFPCSAASCSWIMLTRTCSMSRMIRLSMRVG